MSGLAATLGADLPTAGGPPATATVIADALAARGSGLASWQAGDLQLAVRSAMPVVHELDRGALLVDGDAPARTVADRYAAGGAPALLTGPNPYTLVLADRRRQSLVLARNGDGPTLYWARRGPVVLVASEPAALLAAGVPAEPDPAVVSRFLDTGACDDTPATFFAGITRVLPSQLVEISRPGRVRVRPSASAVPGAAAALAAVDFEGATGVRLGCGAGGAAVLGTALTADDRPRPLPVYSTTFPELADADRAGQLATTLLGPYARGAVRHRTLPVFADDLDVDGYLADVGEPTPQLADWLRWLVARRVAGEVDALVDGGTGGYLSRLADRITSRFGVSLRLPLCGVPDPAGELPAIAHQLLPAVAGYASPTVDEPAVDAVLPELLRWLRVELVSTFLSPLAPASDRDGLAEVLALLAGAPVDAARLWRRYLVERWLRLPMWTGQVGGAPRVGGPGRTGGRSAVEPLAAAGRRWLRQPVRTELLAAGDKLAEKVAWYVSEAAGRTADLAAGQRPDHGPGTTGPWYVLLAAKPAAVMQGRARPLWEVRPGLTARSLHRLTSRQFGPDAPWAVQVAIEEGGWWRLVAAVCAAALGFPRRYAQLAGPAVRAIRRPRPDALPPGQVAVVPGPSDPGQLAAEVVAALRNALPGRAYGGLGGVAVVAGELLGWATPVAADPPPPGLLAALADGDPFGEDQTPIVIAVPVPGDPG